MNEFEALETLTKQLNIAICGATIDVALSNDAREILRKALTPPTAEDVRIAIQNEIEWETEFRDNGFYFKDTADYIVKLDDEGRLLYGFHPTPKISLLIARFYEGQAV